MPWVVLVLVLMTALPVGADLSHYGSTNPTNEGWLATGDQSIGSPTSGPSSTIGAWGISDRSSDPGSALFYAAGEFPQAGEPWTLRAWLRQGFMLLNADDAIDMGIFMEVNDASHRRFLVEFGNIGPSDTLPGFNWVHLSPDGSAAPALSNSWPVAPTDRFMLVELASDGTTADLFVNGVLLSSGYPGFAASAVSPRVLWGAGSSADMGESRWAQVAYVTGTQQCSNGLDDDGDGLTDALDPYCGSVLDPREGPPPVPCDDGVDTDADGICDVAEPEVGTDPLVADTDHDQASDGDELLAGTDPLDPQSRPLEVPGVPALGLAVLAALLGAVGARWSGSGPGDPASRPRSD